MSTNTNPTQSPSIGDAPAVKRATGPVFGRIGTTATVERVAQQALAAGAKVERNEDAGTIRAIAPDGSGVFKAMLKGGGVWLIIYSRAFFEEPQNVSREGGAA